VRYQVKRGETAFTIARSFNISAKALADWNGLGPDLMVREGQFLIIPTPADISRLPADAQVADATAPGEGTPTPTPPSSKEPLPDEETVTVAQAAQEPTPAPDLSSERTAASATAMGMPVDGKILRAWDGKTSQGIDIAAAAGTAVHAAAEGTVAVITHDAKTGALIVILRHADGLLTVYAGLDSATVEKGAAVKRGQTIGTVKDGSPAQLHFEVRQGQVSVDPLTYLQ
jgi:murein DD-endopeptidase MepM/ murein hydrolase activator NlpD